MIYLIRLRLITARFHVIALWFRNMFPPTTGLRADKSNESGTLTRIRALFNSLPDRGKLVRSYLVPEELERKTYPSILIDEKL